MKQPVETLGPGEVGFIVAGIKTVADMRVGDTVTDAENPAAEPLAGFKELKPMVFAGLYPTEANQYGALREAIEKLRLNDASLVVRARDLAGAGLRLPRGLSRPAPHGDRAGAAGARVRSQPGHYRPDCRLPRAHHGGRNR